MVVYVVAVVDGGSIMTTVVSVIVVTPLEPEKLDVKNSVVKESVAGVGSVTTVVSVRVVIPADPEVGKVKVSVLNDAVADVASVVGAGRVEPSELMDAVPLTVEMKLGQLIIVSTKYSATSMIAVEKTEMVLALVMIGSVTTLAGVSIASRSGAVGKV